LVPESCSGKRCLWRTGGFWREDERFVFEEDGANSWLAARDLSSIKAGNRLGWFRLSLEQAGCRIDAVVSAEAKALWSILWRSIVWFPVGLLRLALCVISLPLLVGPFLVAGFYAFVFASQGLWWEAAGCAGVFVVLGLAAWGAGWKRIARWVADLMDSLSPQSPF